MNEALKKRVALSLIEGFGPVTFKKLWDRFGDESRILSAVEADLGGLDRLPKEFSAKLADPALMKKAEKEVAAAEKAGVDILSSADERYPDELSHIFDPPFLLFVKGALPAAHEPKVAIVGSRAATNYGERIARRIAFDLAAAGVVIVSGLAMGIDTAAHEGALEAGGKTVAVLGGGLSHIYPAENRELAGRIAASGAVVSEYPMGKSPRPGFFPVRNRIISGLSWAVLVVEANRQSGALITVDAALEQGRDVFAVPGNVDSTRSDGTNYLIKQGARPATSADDILQELKLRRGRLEVETRKADLSEDEQRLVAAVEAEPLHIDQLLESCGFAPGRLFSLLSGLELKGLLHQLPGNYFSIADSRGARQHAGR